MCLVIDICCLGTVFEGRSKHHAKFLPVLNWINANGRLIYGGTKYNTELAKAAKFLAYVAELSRKRRTVKMPTDQVDAIAAELKRKVPDPQFNDEHLVALVIASRCRVVCTDDKTAISYLRRVDLFSDYDGVSRPSIFRGHKNHKDLCRDEFIVAVCRH
jgi:predicted nucleic acid-binding protein